MPVRELFAAARVNGWAQVAARASSSLPRRMRDAITARHLASPGFRAGRAPRLLGLSNMRLGQDFHAGDALWLEAVLSYAGQRFTPQLTIGPHARLSDNVHIACLRRVQIGAHLLCGSRVLITDHAHGRYSGPEASDPATPPAERALHSGGAIRIGDHVWLGDGVVVLPGAEIGDGCVIAANAVVRGQLEAGTLAGGIPARPLRRWNDAQRTWLPVEQLPPSALVD